MCIYFGKAFACYNAVLTQETRDREGVGNCRQLYEHPRTTYRQNDPTINGPLPANFFEIPCNPRCELPGWEILPLEIIYGYCDICVPRDQDGDADPHRFRAVASLHHRLNFFQEVVRDDWGCRILTREESEADDWRGWRRIAVEESLRPYLRDWQDERGIPRNSSDHGDVRNEAKDYGEANEDNEDEESNESNDGHADNDSGQDDEGGDHYDGNESDEGIHVDDMFESHSQYSWHEGDE